ncbi:MAG: histidinol dehydrogenase, partial [Arthrobacter koreensis]|nr:histidinol dehydrogenase [Arthrobacter koreensis]
MPRAETTTDVASDAVAAIIADVRSRGFAALSELAEKFDGVPQDHPRVPRRALIEALENLDPAVRSGLEESIRRARMFAAAQRPADVEVDIADGAKVTHRWVPVNRVGLYVPGGLAVYPSSVVMNVVPAQAAGVASLALTSPPQKEFGGLP